MTILIGAFFLWLAFRTDKFEINKDAKTEWVLKIEKEEDSKYYHVEVGYYWVAIFVVVFILLLAK